jgi:hypothetical protein
MPWLERKAMIKSVRMNPSTAAMFMAMPEIQSFLATQRFPCDWNRIWGCPDRMFGINIFINSDAIPDPNNPDGLIWSMPDGTIQVEYEK